MINEFQKNLLETECDIIAHQTNCIGLMGAGVAKQIKDKLLEPADYNAYRKLCAQNGATLLGSIQCLPAKNGKIIANLFGENIPTGKGLDTDYVALRRAMMELKVVAEKNNMSIAMPGYMGCGLAGGDWEIVFEMIYTIFAESDVLVEICHLPKNKGGNAK